MILKSKNKALIKANEVTLKEDKLIIGNGDKGITRNGVSEETQDSPSTIVKGQRRVGISKGATVPTVAFGNIKIAVWEERVIPDNDHARGETIEEISKYLDAWLNSEIAEAKSNL